VKETAERISGYGWLRGRNYQLKDAYYEGSRTIEHYQKFLSLWKDADPGLPKVEDAKKRLGG